MVSYSMAEYGFAYSTLRLPSFCILKGENKPPMLSATSTGLERAVFRRSRRMGSAPTVRPVDARSGDERPARTAGPGLAPGMEYPCGLKCGMTEQDATCNAEIRKTSRSSPEGGVFAQDKAEGVSEEGAYRSVRDRRVRPLQRRIAQSRLHKPCID